MRAMNDLFFQDHPEFYGPYKGPDAVPQLHDKCFDLITATDDMSITLTHDDLVPPNIMLSTGPDPKVVAIIDWAQSGLYPWYWEFCKSRVVGLTPNLHDEDVVVEWRTKYLPMLIESVPDDIYYPWFYYVLSWG